MKRLITAGLILASVALLVATASASAQGVTTGAIAGTVTDANGGALPGAVVNAVHEPTGTRYSTVTREDGRYAIHNVRVGGPYQVTATMTGFETQTKNDAFVKLGDTLVLDFILELQSVEETKPRQASSNPR